MTKPGESGFSWQDLGDIQTGRPNLGQFVPVAVYRLMQYTMRHALTVEYGREAATDALRKAGKLAGEQFCLNMLDRNREFSAFVSELKEVLKEQKIGILRVEKADLDKMEIVLTVAEDLDCSGLPVLGEVVCEYDEGFIAGVLKAYTGKDFTVKEIDCWATGDRICRFLIDNPV